MNGVSDWLPALVEFSAYGGRWPEYLEALYEFFRHDFVETMPRFRGQEMKLKRHPFRLGKEATFWHFIQEGEVEDNRIPDLRRCERIRWPRPIIEVDESMVRFWINERRNGIGYILALADFSYKVVLVRRNGYFIPWAAYFIEREHQRKKLEREYLEYVRSQITEAAP